MHKPLILALLLCCAAAGWTQNAPAAPAAPATPAPTTAPAAQNAATPSAAPHAPHKIQAKSKEEFEAYKAADALVKSGPDMSKVEDAAADFEGKFPQSELTPILYNELMLRYQQANDADKTLEMGRKAIALDPESVQAMVIVATVLAEGTRASDLNYDERHDELMKDAKRAIELIDSGEFAPANAQKEQLDMVKSSAYAAMGSIEFVKSEDSHLTDAERDVHYAAAEQELRKATQLNLANPEPGVWLRLAVALDHEKKYSDALEATNRTLQIAGNDPVITPIATSEKKRLLQLVDAGKSEPASKPQ
jgi:tetratricopeptide (TPR) repeat protein